jgi:hypothetical protein
MQSSPASCHFLPSGFKYSPQYLVLKHPQSVSFLSPRPCLTFHNKLGFSRSVVPRRPNSSWRITVCRVIVAI